ncbi:kinase-like domain-containing protein [Rhizophagus irregularis DAOM 181602=DAOM 197198]|nr:kinase-like domain-containing protein [Rhizophagus irregularis DAOM 181602=DAOM 197198]
MKERPKNLWKYIDTKKYKYQYHATIPTTNLTNELNDDDEKIVYINCLEWIPYENFQNITYMAEGGFSKIYSAERLEGHIKYWNIEDQK